MKETKLINPPFFGQLETRATNTRNNERKKANVSGLLLGLCCCIVLGLSLAAMFHRQWICLLWILLMCIPIAIIMLLTRTQKGTHTDQIDQQRKIDISHWLEMQTRQGIFGSLLTKSAKPVWLTEEGVFVYKNALFPWRNFTSFVLEPGTLVRELKPIHRLRLALKEPRTVSKGAAFSAIVLLFVPIVLGVSSLIYYYSRIGMRYDVLALFFANFAAVYLFISMSSRYARERVTETVDVVILFDQQRIHSEQLTSFLHEMLPSK